MISKPKSSIQCVCHHLVNFRPCNTFHWVHSVLFRVWYASYFRSFTEICLLIALDRRDTFSRSALIWRLTKSSYGRKETINEGTHTPHHRRLFYACKRVLTTFMNNDRYFVFLFLLLPDSFSLSVCVCVWVLCVFSLNHQHATSEAVEMVNAIQHTPNYTWSIISTCECAKVKQRRRACECRDEARTANERLNDTTERWTNPMFAVRWIIST